MEKEPVRVGFYVSLHAREGKQAAANLPLTAAAPSASDCHCPGYWWEPERPMPRASEEILAGTSKAQGSHCKRYYFDFPQGAQPRGSFVPLLCPP